MNIYSFHRLKADCETEFVLLDVNIGKIKGGNDRLP